MARRPISLSVQKLPTFPLDVLPDWVAAQVSNVSDAICIAPDMAAMMALSVLSVGAGSRVAVQPRAGHREPVNLYTLGIAESGEGKTMVVDHMKAPVLVIEAELVQNARNDMHDTRVRKATAEQLAAEAKKTALKLEGQDQRRALEAAERLAIEADEIVVQSKPQLLADDITAESLATMVYEQRGRVAFLSDEGGVFDAMQGRYTKEPNLNIYLKGHTGGDLRVNRQNRDELIPHVWLTYGLCVQPVVLENIGRHNEMKGRGLMARFMAYCPETRAGNRDWLAAPALDEAIEAEYSQRMTAILRTLLASNPWSDDTPLSVLPLTPSGTELWLKFRQQIEPQLADGASLRGMRDWANKLAGHVLRVAALLHIATTDCRNLVGPIPDETLTAAIRVGEWLIPHAVAAYAKLAPNDTRELAQRCLTTIKRTWNADTIFTHKKLFDEMRGALDTSDELISPLKMLCEYYWLKPVPYENEDPHKPGRKKSPQYQANPVLWEDEAQLRPPTELAAA
jgi:hypothetical protein